MVDEAANKVAVRWTATGSHRESFMDVEPTGKRINFRGIEIVRIERGQIVERWGEWNGIELMEQLHGGSATAQRGLPPHRNL